MKVFMINPNNERFEAEIVRYFQNVNDKYVIYTLDEKDANGFQIVYATKIVNNSGVRVGVTISDENEWVLVKNFIKETVNQNKNNQPLTIQDNNPVELSELKIDSVRPFKLQTVVVEMFAKNQKTFEITQNVVNEEVSPVQPVPVVEEAPVVEEPTVAPQVVVPEAPAPVATPEVPVTENVATDDNSILGVQFEMPAVPTEDVQPIPAKQPAIETPSPVEVAPVSKSTNDNYKELYEKEVEKCKDLSSQLESLMNDYVALKTKIDQIKGLLG